MAMERRLQVISSHLLGGQPSVGPNPTSQSAFGDNDICIVGAARTPLGSFNGSLSSFSAVNLGSIAIKGALKNGNIEAKSIDTVYMGNVYQANSGQAPARQAAIGAGVPVQAPATTVNKVCASGMKSVMLAASEIQLGTSKIAIAGGMESMSNVPYYLPKVRQGLRIGDSNVVDGLMKDGLVDPYGNYAMGVIAEKTATEQKIDRQTQDQYALRSYERATQAWKDNKIAPEIVPVEIPARGSTPAKVVSSDEEFKRLKADALVKLRGAFGGTTVTAGNASAISDGAAALVLTSGATVRQSGFNVVGVIRAWADAATDPDHFTIAPSLAIPLACKRAGIRVEDVDFFEINEAFAVVAEANCQLLKLPSNKVNVWGGAISLGHPLGCSGARIIVTLLNVLAHHKARYGCAAICNGGGGASAIIIERI